MLILADDEKAMLDGARGIAKQKAMELLVRYAKALGAERFVDTKNVAGVPGHPLSSCRNISKNTPETGALKRCFRSTIWTRAK